MWFATRPYRAKVAFISMDYLPSQLLLVRFSQQSTPLQHRVQTAIPRSRNCPTPFQTYSNQREAVWSSGEVVTRAGDVSLFCARAAALGQRPRRSGRRTNGLIHRRRPSLGVFQARYINTISLAGLIRIRREARDSRHHQDIDDLLPNGQEPGINSGGLNLDQPSYQGVSAAGDTIGIRFHKLCHPRQPHTNLFLRFQAPERNLSAGRHTSHYPLRVPTTPRPRIPTQAGSTIRSDFHRPRGRGREVRQ